MSRICVGSSGRNVRNIEPTPALNMFPKFDEVAISTYLMVFAKIRRPSPMPVARMSRSFSSSTMSAASLATSVALSTEIPTSASWSATASLTPSPMKPTVEPSARCALITRDFCSGVTRANTVVCGSAAASAASSSASSCVPVRTPRTGSARSPQTLLATRSLSPVITLTSTPSSCSRAIASAASAFGGSTKVRNPASSSPSSSLARKRRIPARVARGDGDDATAARELRVEHRLRLRRNAATPCQDELRRALDDHRARLVRAFDQDRGDAAFVVERSFGEAAVRGEADRVRAGRRPQRLVERGSADGGAAVVHDHVGAEQPVTEDRLVIGARCVERRSEADAALRQRARLVGEEDLDVPEVLDRDETLDDHLSLREPPGAGREADADDRRQQLGREPDRDREREEERLDDGAAERHVDDQDRDRECAREAHEQNREVAKAELERRLRLALAELRRDLAELGPAAGLDDDPDAAPGPDDGSHEGARRQLERRLWVRHRLDVLLRRRRLAGEDGLVALQSLRLEQAQVGGHHVADADADDVARYELGHVDDVSGPLPQRDDRVPELRVQRVDSARGAVLAHEPEPDTEPADQEDDDRVRPLAEERRRDRRSEEQEQERVPQLADEDGDRPGAVAAQRVRPDALEACSRFRRREPVAARIEGAQHVLGRHRGGVGQVDRPRWSVPLRPGRVRRCHASADGNRSTAISIYAAGRGVESA